MENQENPFVKLRQPLSMVGVIRETMNTTVRNRRPMLLILCLVILTTIQIEAATRYDWEPPLQQGYFSIQISTHRIMAEDRVTRDVREQLLTKFHILFSSCCLLLYLALTTISSSYESYTGNTLSIIDVFLKVSRNWKRPLLTSGCILFFILGINLVYIISVAVILLLEGRSRVTPSNELYIATLILKWICSAYVAALSVMSIVVSVLEDSISGIKAIDRAGELMKGKRIQASLAMMLCYIAHLLVQKAFVALSMKFEEWAMWEVESPFIIGFTCLLEVLVFVFYTVFYHECKIKHEDGILCARSVADKSS